MRSTYTLQVDVKSDEIVFERLRACGTVKAASSEEQTECQDLGGHGYSVSKAWQHMITPNTRPHSTRRMGHAAASRQACK